tara:strand:+ start:4259 stop:4453 length:195 start_codon:yes stop_codon:yes gene_type:complete
MTLKKFKNRIDQTSGLIETLEYDFFDPQNEEAATEISMLIMHCLTELENIAERDEAFRRFKKND